MKRSGRPSRCDADAAETPLGQKFENAGAHAAHPRALLDRHDAVAAPGEVNDFFFVHRFHESEVQHRRVDDAARRVVPPIPSQDPPSDPAQ